MTYLRLALSLILVLSVSCEKEKKQAAEPESTATKPVQKSAGADDKVDHAKHSAHEHMEHKVMPADAIDEGASVYQLDVDLVGHDGEPRSWKDFQGKPLVITMIYSTCTTACPLIVQEVKKILEAANAEDQQVLLVSMDAERDTPEALTEMKKRHHLGDNWTLVRPSESDVREIASALGIRYRKLPSGDFNHSQVISLLDADGLIAARAEGLGPQRDDVVEAVKKRSD